MNKAFVKEDDTIVARCPKCSSPGSAVYRETLEAHLKPEALRQLNDLAFFCPFPRCPVVYFDLFERSIDESQVATPVYPKNPAAPLCACFGLTTDDVEADLQEGGVTRTRACVDRAKSAEARCSIASPTGQSCIAEVQKYYMRRRAELGGG